MNNQQWQQIEGYAATDLNDDYAICLLELRDRVVALESRQRPAVSAEVRPATDEPTDRELRELFWYRPKGLETEAAALRRVYQAGMAAAVQSSAQQEIADAEAFGLTPTSGSLVERVAGAIDNAPYDVDRHQWDEARAAIRAIAAWLRDRGFTWVAQTLEQEADR